MKTNYVKKKLDQAINLDKECKSRLEKKINTMRQQEEEYEFYYLVGEKPITSLPLGVIYEYHHVKLPEIKKVN